MNFTLWSCSSITSKPGYNINLFFLRLLREADGEWEEEEKLEAHSDWVRDVAWAPNIGLPTSKIASCSQVSGF